MRRGVRGVQVTLRYIKAVTKASGAVFRYLRYPGAKLIPLPAEDDPGFLAAYVAALAKAKAEAHKPAYRPETVAGAISDYLLSPDFARLSAATRQQRRQHLTAVQAVSTNALLADLRPRHIALDVRALGGHPGINRLKAWRGFLAWAKAEHRIESDPSRDVDRPATAKSDGHVRWTRDDMDAFRKRWPSGPERIAFEVLQWTGAGAKDACALGPGMIRRGALQFGRSKTGEPFTVPVAFLPPWAKRMEADRQHFLAATKDHPHMTWIVTEAGASRSHKAFSQWFSERAGMAGVAKTAHGLRKLRAVEITESGGTKEQRKAWLGHLTDAESAHYAKGADQRKVLGLETARGNRVATGLKVVK